MEIADIQDMFDKLAKKAEQKVIDQNLTFEDLQSALRKSLIFCISEEREEENAETLNIIIENLKKLGGKYVVRCEADDAILDIISHKLKKLRDMNKVIEECQVIEFETVDMVKENLKRLSDGNKYKEEYYVDKAIQFTVFEKLVKALNGGECKVDIGKTLKMTLKKLGDRKEQLPCLETYVQNEISALVDAEDPIRESFMKRLDDIQQLDGKKGYHFSGSVVEGAMLARWFKNDEGWHEIEVDCMFNFMTIPHEVSHLVEPVEDKPGFVRLPYSIFYPTSSFLQFQYIDPLWIKDIVKENCERQFIHEISFLKRYWLKCVNVNFVNSKTETTVELKWEGGSGEVSEDVVPAGHLLFWPQQATTWITRQRLWPPQDIIQSIIDKGCQVVARSSPGGDIHSEWRFSFSGPEAILAQLRSKNQQQAYYFIKVFFYRYLKCVKSSEPEGKSLYSYIIKTTMLWGQEELPPEDSIWASLENSVQMLLFKLLGHLETGFLPHYFILEINLLERVGGDVRIKCAAIINRWISSILMTAPFNMLEMREYIKSSARELRKNQDVHDQKLLEDQIKDSRPHDCNSAI